MSRERKFFIYMLTNRSNRVLYTGVTNNLHRRIYEHKNKLINGFTKRYNVEKLVYFEETVDIRDALNREKEIKGWRRGKKNNLVNSLNPEWRDLANDLY